MPPPLDRRRALIAAGQGMAALLLAACGGAAGEASPTGSAATRGGTGRSLAASATGGSTTAAPAATVPEVTVPALDSTGPSTGARTLLPLNPTTPAATDSSAPSAPMTSASPSRPTVTTAPTGSTPQPATARRATSSQATSSPGTTSRPSSTRGGSESPTTSSTTRPTTSTRSSTAASSTSRSTSSRRPGSGVAGRLVAIDPGHNGGNGAHPEIINKLIDGGYGQRNVCNTTGTQTDAGYTEHQFTWQVAGHLRALLEDAGVTVLMTRTSDAGVGPCTNVRAAMENRADADAVVSIHGDGAPPAVRGFYVLTATRPPAGKVIAARSLRLASAIADAAVANGFPPSNTLGSGGLWKRDDLTGLNLSMRPKILIECGNMRNAVEAALMSSTDGQRRYARALADGVFAYLEANSS